MLENVGYFELLRRDYQVYIGKRPPMISYFIMGDLLNLYLQKIFIDKKIRTFDDDNHQKSLMLKKKSG